MSHHHIQNKFQMPFHGPSVPLLSQPSEDLGLKMPSSLLRACFSRIDFPPTSTKLISFHLGLCSSVTSLEKRSLTTLSRIATLSTILLFFVLFCYFIIYYYLWHLQLSLLCIIYLICVYFLSLPPQCKLLESK